MDVTDVAIICQQIKQKVQQIMDLRKQPQTPKREQLVALLRQDVWMLETELLTGR